ncbi:MAG: adenylate/guanylate cyclase domain-containing protein [Chloroflexota bacterium]
MSDVTSAAGTAARDPLETAHQAIKRHDWAAAFDALTEAEQAHGLSGHDLEDLAMAAFFTARGGLTREIKERAFSVYEAEGDAVRAAYLAVDIAREYGYQGQRSIAGVWIRRAERLVGTDSSTYVDGFLALGRSEAAAASGDMDAALAFAESAIDIGRRVSHPDLSAYALVNLGALKIASGSTIDGVALMEEAAISAVDGELSPFTTGVTACRMISACRDLTDYRRATEWIEATERYCDRQSLSGFPGVCRIHRAEVAAVGGAWDSAEAELERATSELEAYKATPPQADGFYAIGDIRRLRGDFAGAEAALREAHQRGRSPQPALALLRLAEGKVKAAFVAIEAAVADESWDHWAHTRLLPARVEIAIAAGEVATARNAVDAFSANVAEYPSPALVGNRQTALGRVLLAEGDAAGAARELRAAIKTWREVGAPYEIARARAVLSRALQVLGDEDDADFERSAALEEFRRLGAKVDVAVLEREERDMTDRRAAPSTTRMTFMFTDIVGSTNLADAIGDDAWERVLRWHDETLRTAITDGGGDVVNTTGDGFFAAFGSARQAVATAIAIQRALLSGRDTVFVVPAVRIGLHTAEATVRGTDYSGKGVHVAARVGSLASGGEILATAAVLAEAGQPDAMNRRAEQIRGVAEPVEIAAIAWS